jgi:hypothetical protein
MRRNKMSKQIDIKISGTSINVNNLQKCDIFLEFVDKIKASPVVSIITETEINDPGAPIEQEVYLEACGPVGDPV